MAQNTLKIIIDTENAIRAMLAAERQKAAEWLERVKREAEESLREETARLAEVAGQKAAAARLAAQRGAEETVQLAARRAERLENLGAEELRQIVRPHLARIVPETVDDRADVEG